MFTPSWARTALGLVLFGISFGYVEAAVVVYARIVEQPVLEQVYPGRPPEDLFPLLTVAQLEQRSPLLLRLVGVEVAREAATMLMLGAVAYLAVGSRKGWAAAFSVAFGIWDLFYYVFLKVLIDWPASLFTWDVLFLIPVPWASPVLAPCLVAASMTVLGLLALARPAPFRAAHWAGVAAGCAVILYSFVADSANLMAGGVPHPFSWAVFLLGEAVLVASAGCGLLRPANS